MLTEEPQLLLVEPTA